MKIAYFSPLNPQPSGISDYSEELLGYLRDYGDVDLFVDGFTPSNPWLTGSFQIFDYQVEPSVLEQLTNYDATIYHIGNDHRYHSAIYGVLKQHPGIVVFHDFALQDFFLGLARAQGNMEVYLDELEACYGKAERLRAAEFFARGALPPQVNAQLDFPLNERMARSAEGIIVHSEWSRHRLRLAAPGVPIALIRHHITAHAAATPSIKDQNDEERRVEIASFGLITPDKGIERALRALAALRDDHNFHYTLVGSAENFPDLPQMIRKYGLENHVSVTNYVALAEFQQRIVDTDIAINLRERPVGATSGSLCRIMAAGIPAIVSNVGAFSELPDGSVVKIDHDEHFDGLIQAYLRKLIENPSLRLRIGENARNHVLANHKIEMSAGKYVAFIHDVIARRPRKKLIDKAKAEMTALGISALDEVLLRDVAVELATIAPADNFTTGEHKLPPVEHSSPSVSPKRSVTQRSNGNSQKQVSFDGRLAKVEGIDYKRGALDYTKLLTSELKYYLRTKPFCNLHKPIKYSGDGMDPETHRHFTDFANIAVTLALRPDSRILDVACGPGWLSEYFARLGYDVTGIDISDDLINVARERLEQLSYQVDYDTEVKCRFMVHDIEGEPLNEKFDSVICYDALHHFEDESKVFSNLGSMLNLGGWLFILEGEKPAPDSATEEELRGFMEKYKTLESPFSKEYLYRLLNDNGFAIVGDYVSVNGLFERQILEGSDGEMKLPLRTVDTNYHYLTCIKVSNDQPASSVPDSRQPGRVRAEITTQAPLPPFLEPAESVKLSLIIKNTGDTLWLTAQTTRKGVVMPGVRIFNVYEDLVSEIHGPLLPRAVAPGQSIVVKVNFETPSDAGIYVAKIDLVDQHICWFEDRGSRPLSFTFEVRSPKILDQVIEELKKLEPWFHYIELGDGLATKSRSAFGEPLHHPHPTWEKVKACLPNDLTDQSVLDVGCNAGFYSIEMKRRGAARVLGIDSQKDLIRQATFVRNVKGLDIEYQRMSVYDLDPRDLGQFDITLALGLIYHCKHLVLALEKLFLITQKLLVLETAIYPPNKAPESFSYPVGSNEPTLHPLAYIENPPESKEAIFNWFLPSTAALTALLQNIGFDEIEVFPGAQTDRAILACRKNQPYPDSRSITYLAARLTMKAGPSTCAAGQVLQFRVLAENTGNAIWLRGSTGEAEKGDVNLVAHLLAPDGSTISWYHAGAVLPHNVAPGEATEIEIMVPAPEAKGAYRLEFDMVSQHLAWFEDLGSLVLGHDLLVD